MLFGAAVSGRIEMIEGGEGAGAFLYFVFFTILIDGEDGDVSANGVAFKYIEDRLLNERHDIGHLRQSSAAEQVSGFDVAPSHDAVVVEQFHAAVVHEHAEEGIGILSDVARKESDALTVDAFYGIDAVVA